MLAAPPSASISIAEIWRRISILLQATGRSEYEVSQAAGLSHAILSDLRRGKYATSAISDVRFLRSLQRLAAAFGLPADYFYRDSTDTEGATFGAEVRRQRRLRAWRQADLEAASRIDQSTTSRVEQDPTFTYTDLVQQALAQALGIELGTPDPQQPPRPCPICRQAVAAGLVFCPHCRTRVP